MISSFEVKLVVENTDESYDAYQTIMKAIQERKFFVEWMSIPFYKEPVIYARIVK